MVRLIRGDSYSYAAALKGIADLTGYSCIAQLRDASNGDLIASSTPLATPDPVYGEVFVAQITDTQSKTLTINGQYTLGLQISDGDGFAREECRTIKIIDECVY
jgi:hypothetical protein